MLRSRYIFRVLCQLCSEELHVIVEKMEHAVLEADLRDPTVATLIGVGNSMTGLHCLRHSVLCPDLIQNRDAESVIVRCPYLCL